MARRTWARKADRFPRDGVDGGKEPGSHITRSKEAAEGGLEGSTYGRHITLVGGPEDSNDPRETLRLEVGS